MEEKLQIAIESHQKPEKYLAYGTAGFRDKYVLPLHSTFVRMGILACLRSFSVSSKSVGVMITASHNPEEDNGIKIVDFDGGMLDQSWEPYAERFANAEAGQFMEEFNYVISQENIDMTGNVPVVIIGRDTRWHSAELSACVELGIAAMGGVCHQLGEVITPQLHFTVHHLNTTLPAPVLAIRFSAADCLNFYYNTLFQGFSALSSTSTSMAESAKSLSDKVSPSSSSSIVVDASCGVGSIVLEAFSQTILRFAAADNTLPLLNIEVRNANGSGKVNEGCGAELVQKNQVPPRGVSAHEDANRLMCSFDGDGDRIIFHGFSTTDSGFSLNTTEGGTQADWILLDGDKIAALITTLLFNELVAAELDKDYTLGIVQTAYANGASTQFLRGQGVHVSVAKTGVKFVHHKALDFDVGVYFEANGHGTVLFSEKVTKAIQSFDCSAKAADGEERKVLAFRRLQASLQLINQTVGDALSDMLVCLAALKILNMDMWSWRDLYTDLPSHQVKVCVPDKSRVTCSEDETRILTPSVMQDDLDKAMQSVSNGRCFVRPSGTEDVVRIYAEAATQEEANELSRLTKEAIVKHLC